MSRDDFNMAMAIILGLSLLTIFLLLMQFPR